MKLFIFGNKVNLNILLPILFCLFLLNSCATYKTQLGKYTQNDTLTIPTEKNLDRSIILIGDAGNAHDSITQNVLIAAAKKASFIPSQTDVLFLGDNIYPKGMPKKKHRKKRKKAEKSLENQMKLAEYIDGKTIFIPGNHDWYRGADGIKRQSDFIEKDKENKKYFLPQNNCGLESISLSDAIEVIVVDSKWFLLDWSNHLRINDGCEIKTRADFFDEFKSLVNKNQNKTVLIAIHHPLMSNGPHGGKLSWNQQLFPYKNIPLPILGSVLNFVRIKSGASPEDLHFKVYQDLIDRLTTILKDYPNTILVSGHEHNLQWIFEDDINQIISGSGSKISPAKVNQDLAFSASERGFVVLNIFKNRKIEMAFFGHKNNFETPIFTKIIKDKKEFVNKDYTSDFPPFTKASVYPKEITKKSKFYKWLWGAHYRKYFGTEITAKTLIIDTIHGGLSPKIAGGGNQSMSLRLVNPDGKEYVMRALEKNATQFLQAAIFQNQYVKDKFENTSAKTFIADYYTTAHPFTPFVLDVFTKKLEILHTQPELFYIPKQEALNHYNESYGDALYMLEERPSKEHKDAENFGKPDDIISSDELFENLRKDEKYQVDTEAYLKARLFDILIGDWDRHADQWRWAEFDTKKNVLYKPIPRDRDQAFAKIDGFLLAKLKKLPPLRHMQSFSEKMAHPRWINKTAFPMDVLFLTKTTSKDWEKIAEEIQQTISDGVIKEAFDKLPPEVKDQTLNEIIEVLKSRRSQLVAYAQSYYKQMRKFALITGTDKEDHFKIISDKKSVKIIQYRTNKKDEEKVLETIFYANETKEIWIYALDDKDIFSCESTNDSKIKIRLIGGLDKDTYEIANSRNIHIYDYKNEKNTLSPSFSKRNEHFTNDYENNTFLPQKAQISIPSTIPSGGYNPDDGIKLGVKTTLKKYKFIQKPFSESHSLGINYSFITSGMDFSYKNIVPFASSKWNFAFDSHITNSSFVINYFGFGNETINNDDRFGMDFNRVRMQIFRFSPSLFWEGRNGGYFSIKSSFESLEVEESTNRYINIPNLVDARLFVHQRYAGTELGYDFNNYDNNALPNNGMAFHLKTGWKSNLSFAEKNFFYVESGFNFAQKINPSGTFVLQTNLEGTVISNNDFEFYQGATIGGNKGLRSYRNERFLGQKSFFHSTDFRTELGSIKASFVPMKFGMIAGFDYGRVWIHQEESTLWHTSTGLGLWLSAIEMVAAQANIFHGREGWRFTFGFHLDF